MADHLHSIPDGSRRSGTLLDDIRLESDGVHSLLGALAWYHRMLILTSDPWHRDLLAGVISSVQRALRKEPLLAAMLVAVIVGIVTGTLARGLHLSAHGIELLGQLQAIKMPIFILGLIPYWLMCVSASGAWTICL